MSNDSTIESNQLTLLDVLGFPSDQMLFSFQTKSLIYSLGSNLIHYNLSTNSKWGHILNFSRCCDYPLNQDRKWEPFDAYYGKVYCDEEEIKNIIPKTDDKLKELLKQIKDSGIDSKTIINALSNKNESMDIKEAKQILKQNGFILEDDMHDRAMARVDRAYQHTKDRQFDDLDPMRPRHGSEDWEEGGHAEYDYTNKGDSDRDEKEEFGRKVAEKLVDYFEPIYAKRGYVPDEYGGGDGMLLRCEPVFAAIESVKSQDPSAKVILPTPVGKEWNQGMARDFVKGLADDVFLEDEKVHPRKDISAKPTTHYIILCPHYEGYDERILSIVDYPISLGKYVLTGGELPALIIIDSVVRLIPGVLGGEKSAEIESFSDGDNLEYPQYTKPYDFRGMTVPDVLLSGNHGEIAKWRAEHSGKAE